MPNRAPVDHDRIRDWIRAIRIEQGLPPVITDRATLERIAAIFRLAAGNPKHPAGPAVTALADRVA